MLFELKQPGNLLDTFSEVALYGLSLYGGYVLYLGYLTPEGQFLLLHEGLGQLDIMPTFLVVVVETQGAEQRLARLTPILLVVVVFAAPLILLEEIVVLSYTGCALIWQLSLAH